MNTNDTVIYSVGMTLEELEKLAILKAYNHFKNKTTTAQSLGIAIRTLDNKLDKYTIEEEERRRKLEDEQHKRADLLSRARGNPPNNLGIPYNAYIPNNTDQTLQRHFSSPNAGIRMESIVNAATQPAVPMPERTEVQTVLPKQAPQSGKGKHR